MLLSANLYERASETNEKTVISPFHTLLKFVHCTFTTHGPKLKQRMKGGYSANCTLDSLWSNLQSIFYKKNNTEIFVFNFAVLLYKYQII